MGMGIINAVGVPIDSNTCWKLLASYLGWCQRQLHRPDNQRCLNCIPTASGTPNLMQANDWDALHSIGTAKTTSLQQRLSSTGS
jgi:hypothetical protein